MVAVMAVSSDNEKALSSVESKAVMTVAPSADVTVSPAVVVMGNCSAVQKAVSWGLNVAARTDIWMAAS